MIDADHELSIGRQAQLLDLSRASIYYRPQPTSAEDLAVMRRIDELHLEHPFAGARMLRDLLRQDGFAIGRKHVATLMRTENGREYYAYHGRELKCRPADAGNFPSGEFLQWHNENTFRG